MRHNLDALRQIKSDVLLTVKSFINISALKKKNPALQVHTYKSLVKTIKKRNDVCHIIASGYSAIDAYKRGIVRENDYIIGMNFSAFLPYHYDFYFCEDTSRDLKSCERIKKQVLLLSKCKNTISKLVFKNIYSSDSRLLSELLNQNRIEYVIVLDKQLVYNFVNKLLKKPGVMMPQYSSTVITATMLAYHAGFKQIIIHGLDFSGPHLYHDEELQKQIGMEPPTPYVFKDIKHGSASTQELIWHDLIKAFSERGVAVFCASPDSKFKEYTKVYK